MRIRLLDEADLDVFVDHVVRHMAENNADGGPLFAPFAEMPKTPDEVRDKNEVAWRADVGQQGWMRTWGAFDDAGKLVGHADLRDRGWGHTEHRALLGMGIIRAYRRRGLGTRLLQVVADWARATGLSWIDLFVLEPNAPAQALYRSFGFVEVSRYPDFFRIGERSVADVGMVLDLRSPL